MPLSYDGTSEVIEKTDRQEKYHHQSSLLETMSRFTVFLAFFALQNIVTSPVSAVDVTVYTKDFPPFSLDGEGFSIDYVKQVLVDIYGQAVNVNVTKLPGNQEIFDSLVNTNDTTSDFSLGTAGISITATRDANTPFLPPFFQSGFQVMAHSNTSLNELVKRVVRNFFIVFGIFMLVLFLIVYIVGGLAWFFEFAFPGEGNIPIFIDYEARARGRKPVVCCGYVCLWISPTLKVMMKEIWNAYYWTALTLGGVQTGYPVSKVTYNIHSILKGLRIAFFIIATASFTTVMQASSTTTKIDSYADLRENTVCTVSGSTSEAYLNQNNIGFGILEAPDVETMFDNFWAVSCDAVVYDFPALQAAIVERDNEHGSADAIIVGEIFNREYYGIATSQSMPDSLFATLKQAVITLNNNPQEYEALEGKWFNDIKNVSGDQKVDIPIAVYVVPSVLGIGILLMAMAWLYRRYDEKSELYRDLRKQKYDRDYRDDLQDVLRQESDIEPIYRGSDWLLDQIAIPYIIRILRVQYERELREKGVDIIQLEQGLAPMTRSDTYRTKEQIHQIRHPSSDVEMGHIEDPHYDQKQ